MEALLSRYRNLTVLLVVVVGQLLYLAYQVKTARDERLIRVWAVSAVTPMAGVVEAIRHNTIGFLEDYFILLDVRDQNREVERANPSMAGKAHVANFVMVEQVRGEKYRRDDEGADHACAMRAHPSELDENESGEQQNRRASVKDRVQRRERMVRFQSDR